MATYIKSQTSHSGSLKRSRESSVIGDFGSRSELSFFEKESAPEKGFMWKSQWQHAMYFIAYTFSWDLFASYKKDTVVRDQSEVPSWIHIVIMYVFFAGPFLYMQIFIGQYTHKGCLMVGEMLPLAYGLGYVMLMITMLNCSLNMYYCSILLYYTFVSMINYPTPSWMLCLKEYSGFKEKCYSRDDIDQCYSCQTEEAKEQGECFNPEEDTFSATLFMNYITFGNSQTEGVIGTPSTVQSANLVLTVIIILSLSVRSLKDLDDSIRIWNLFAIVTIVITTAVVLLNNPRLDFIPKMFGFSPTSLFSLTCWTNAITATVRGLNLLEGGHFMFGSYMPLTVNCTNRVTYILVVHMCFLGLGHMEAYVLEDYLSCSLNLHVTDLRRYNVIESTFSIYPTALGILAAAQLWATLFFLILFTLTLHSIVIQIILIQESLSQKMIDPIYYIYTRIVLILAVSIIALLFTILGGSELVSELLFGNNRTFFLVISMLYFVLFMYGVDRISDDMHFILHSPPSKYLKWSWALTGVVSFAILVILMTEPTEQHYPNTIMVFKIIIYIPIPIGLFYQVIMAVRARELSSLVKPSNEFGPESNEEKANRRLFNPRYEVRFRRRHNVCKHRCLLNSVTLKRCLEKELTLLTHVLVEIQDNEEERALKKDFLDALRVHQDIMSKALIFDPSQDYLRIRRNEFAKDPP